MRSITSRSKSQKSARAAQPATSNAQPIKRQRVKRLMTVRVQFQQHFLSDDKLIPLPGVAALDIDPSMAHVLLFKGTLTNNTYLSIDQENRAKLRAWLERYPGEG